MLKLGKATAADLDSIVSIQRASFKAIYDKYQDQYDPYVEDVERIKWKLTEKANCLYYFVCLNDKRIGFIRIVTDDDLTEAWLGTAAILPHYQRQGFGSAAISLIEENFPTIKQWDLCTILQEQPLVNFYQKCGYRTTVTKPEQEGMDMVYMTKTID